MFLGAWCCGEAVPCLACSALDCGGRAELFVTEMAEGELDVDSLISRLLEGESATIFCTYNLDIRGITPPWLFAVLLTPVGRKIGPLDSLA